jgi:hypothetical protein
MLTDAAQTNPHAIPFIQTEQRLCGNILQVHQLLALEAEV